MSEDDSNQVEIKADRATESLGHNAYSGDTEHQDRKSRELSTILMLALVLTVFFGMFCSKKTLPISSDQKSLMPSSISPLPQNDLSPRLLTERDLNRTSTNSTVAKQLKDLGQIQILNLSTSTQLPIGSEMSAVLVSGATNGIVKARLTQPLISDGEPILQAGSVLFGRGRSGEERLFVEFTKVILPSGESIPIRAQAFDVSDRIQGLKGAAVGGRTKKMAGAIAFGLMGGMAEGLQETTGSLFMPRRPSTREAALSGASKAALNQSQSYLDEMKKSPNIIEVKAGQEIVFITDEPKKTKQGELDESR